MLPDYPHLLLFLTATLILNLTPGNDVLYVASQSLQHKRLGILAALGISTGIIVYIIATAFGLAGILRQSPLAFNIIKIAGGIYLIYLAWQVFTKPTDNMAVIAGEQQKFGYKAYYKGICTTLLNPKVGIFFITFLPQFVAPARGKVWLQLLSLGACFIISGTIVNIVYVFLFSHLKERLFSKMGIRKWLNKLTAFIFCAIALKILTAKQN